MMELLQRMDDPKITVARTRGYIEWSFKIEGKRECFTKGG